MREIRTPRFYEGEQGDWRKPPVALYSTLVDILAECVLSSVQCDQSNCYQILLIRGRDKAGFMAEAIQRASWCRLWPMNGVLDAHACRVFRLQRLAGYGSS